MENAHVNVNARTFTQSCSLDPVCFFSSGKQSSSLYLGSMVDCGVFHSNIEVNDKKGPAPGHDARAPCQ